MQKTFASFVAFVLLIGLPCATVQAAEPANVLIKNVRLIDRQGIAEDVVVNILITDGELKVVTKDDIAAEVSEIAVDAQNGFLLGKLDMGQPPSFVILDQDPRKKPEVLLDTKTHVRFAVLRGVIANNDLPKVATSPPGTDQEPGQTGWLAYAAPPLALPLDYHDSTKWNRWDTKVTSGLLTGAVVLDRTRWLQQDDASRSQVGDLEDFDGGEIRALRLGVVGKLNFPKPWIYTVYGTNGAFDKGFDTTKGSSFAWYDYRLDIPFIGGSTFSIGKQKEPISMERLMALTFMPWQERSAPADALLPARNHGIVVSGTAFKRRMSWAGGIFNNWIDSEQSFEENPTQFIGRLTWLPFVSSDNSNLLHLGFGVRRASDNDIQGVQYRTEPEVDQAPLYVDTGAIATNNTLTYNLEASWRKGPFWLSGEYIYTDVDSQDDGELAFKGYHVGASWALTGEMRSYRRSSGIFNQLPVAKSVLQGGWGALELAARYSDLDLTDGPVDGGKMDISTIGLNWWLTPSYIFNMNYRYITLERFGIEGISAAWTARLVLILQ